MEAVLWPQVRRPGVNGVISHQSALSIHELSDVSPARVHLTLPTTVRIRREVPKGLVIHYPAAIGHGYPVGAIGPPNARANNGTRRPSGTVLPRHHY